MIKLLKVGNNIYKKVLEDGVEEYLQDLEGFRKITIDTINWRVGNNVKKQAGNFTELSASNSKAIVLLTKVLASLNPDLSNLTDLEKSAWDKLTIFANNEYANSELLNNSLQAVQDYVVKGNDLINKALEATSKEELVGIINEL